MDIFTTINRQRPLLAIGGALIFLGWTVQHHLLGNSGGLRTSDGLGEPATLQVSVPKISSKLTASEFNQISERHLFGKVEKPKAEEPKPAEEPKDLEPDFSNLPETRIPLKLSGIAFSPDKQRAFAMIITADGKQADYQAGEPIGKEATVHLIEEKRVVIDRNGNFEALTLPEISGSQGAARPTRVRSKRSQPNQPRQNNSASVRPAPTKQQ